MLTLEPDPGCVGIEYRPFAEALFHGVPLTVGSTDRFHHTRITSPADNDQPELPRLSGVSVPPLS